MSVILSTEAISGEAWEMEDDQKVEVCGGRWQRHTPWGEIGKQQQRPRGIACAATRQADGKMDSSRGDTLNLDLRTN